MIELVPVLLVDKVWPQLQPYMVKACVKGGGQYTEGWLHTVCRKGEAYLVVDYEGTEIKAGVVCQEQNWSGRIVLNLLACGGKKYDRKAFSDFARETLGFERVVFEGAEGWQRTPGVRIVRYIYEMDLNHER